MKDIPAFPVQDASTWQAHGMTLRDYFAAKAMQSFLVAGPPSSELADKFKGFTVAEFVSTRAYEMADEMLKAREA